MEVSNYKLSNNDVSQISGIHISNDKIEIDNIFNLDHMVSNGLYDVNTNQYVGIDYLLKDHDMFMEYLNGIIFNLDETSCRIKRIKVGDKTVLTPGRDENGNIVYLRLLNTFINCDGEFHRCVRVSLVSKINYAFLMPNNDIDEIVIPTIVSSMGIIKAIQTGSFHIA
jgi:hypothetical protein